MYVPDIHSLPLRTTTAVTSDHVFVDDGDLQVGIWEAAPGEQLGSTDDYDEVMFMVGGRTTVRHDGGTFDLVPGALWSTPRSWRGDWYVHQTVRKMYVIDHRPGGAASPEYLSNAYSADLGAATPRPVVLAGDPRERSVTVSAHNRLEAGVWDCTPGSFPFRRDGYDEVFCVLAGHATLSFDSGLVVDLRPGSVLLTPSGSTGRWDVHDTVRKAYVMIHERP
ncbi:MAG: cupin domain-containing protein [Ilumatobacteraceae bacterium]